MSTLDVGLALRNTPRGQLKYDKFWYQDGRIKEVLDEISEFNKVKLSVSPKMLSSLMAEMSIKDEVNGIETKNPALKTSHSKKTDITDAYFYELQSEMESPILEYKEERLKYIQDVFNEKKSEYDIYSNELEQQINQEYLLLKRRKELDAKRRAGDLEKIEKEILEEAKKKEMIQREQHQNHAKKLSAKIQEAEMKQKEVEEEIRRRQQEQLELNSHLKICLNEAQNIIAKSLEKLTSCEYPNNLRVSPKERLDEMTKIMQILQTYVEQATTRELNIDDILNANLRVKDIYELFQDIVNDIESAKTKALQIRRDKLSAFSFKDPCENNGSSSSAPHLLPIPEVQHDSNNAVLQEPVKEIASIKEVEEKKALSQFIAPDAVEEYERISSNLKHVENLLQPLKSDPRNKKYRFELQKAINTPINSLSSNSGSEIKAKVKKLLSILEGKYPEMFQRDLSRDVAAYSFCSFLMAKQFVEQGYSQISAQHSTAYPIALALLSVWSRRPELGDLILGHFYARCPYLVPFYPPRRKGQTDADYFSSLGYHVDEEGAVEETHKFLSRMSGYARLYAAVIVSAPDDPSRPHPHGVRHAWRWLARALNLEPRPDVTATVLLDLLEVTGHALMRDYGRQFRKAVHVVCKAYFPRIRAVTPLGSGGPVERLETFLKQTANKGSVPPPQGYLDASFWSRRG